MSDLTVNVDRVLTLAAAVCDESASQNEFMELDSVLLADATSRRRYMRYCRFHVSLETEMHARLALRKMEGRDDLDSAVPTPWESDVLTVAIPPTMPVVSPVPTILSTTLPSTVGYFSSGWPVAYLVATVIFGIGLLIGSLVHVSEPAQVARQSSVPSRMVAEPKMESVGRITGMVDCKWAGTAFRVSCRSFGKEVRAGFRSDGNHLRHGG